MPDDEKEQDPSDPAAEKPRTERSFIDHLLNQPEGPGTRVSESCRGTWNSETFLLD